MAMEQYLRDWRQDAINRSQYETAVFVGDKLLALTSRHLAPDCFLNANSYRKDSDGDAFWLAQVHFTTGSYSRALALLSREDLVSRNPACRYLAGLCYIKQNQFEQALTLLGESNPTELITDKHGRRKIPHLRGQSHVTLRNGKTTRETTRERDERDEEHERNIKFEASICYLRGLCFAKQNNFDRARECYETAVRIDVQCFEALDQLTKNSLMTPKQELELLESLCFDSIHASDPSVAQEAAEFTKMLYTTRLSKYSSPSILSNATETLSTHYKLANNPDILLSRAEMFYTQCRFNEALELTSSIITTHTTDFTGTASQNIHHRNQLALAPAAYPLHLACLYETGAINDLFLLSHMLADYAPEESYTYLAIGVYYLAVSKIPEARRFFSKASLLDPHSAPAWIGFAHSFAAEGEHEQAIAAYSTAARLFQGSHLPQLFLGMQHLALNNMTLAYEYLWAANAMSTGMEIGASVPTKSLPSPLGGDPLVLNELGVVFYHQNSHTSAVALFRQALNLATSLHCEPGAWVATRVNLGHALRRMGQFSEALTEFDECLRVGSGGNTSGYSPFLGRSAGGSATVPSASGVGGYEDRGLVGSLHTSRGLVLLELGRNTAAVESLHEAVRILGAPGGGDSAGGAGIAQTLLARALEIWALEGREKDHTTGRDRSSASVSPSKHRIEAAIEPETELEAALDNNADEVLRRAGLGRTRRRPARSSNPSPPPSPHRTRRGQGRTPRAH
ncbi:hypothetical protein N7495_001307 [Penicillium taxi]|uniref:uncharacterized protein n=1 Tax=Penicillium taxi TaxID=168475 RepID=UPI0025456CAC|nr:uncharacterized protein N7495_001307 [Penicillium taxi]KAJ5908625.1 hypothetical protein N7495_001307 [Penicillium taxi]